MNLEQKAREFATKAHEGQLRKYTNLPYITHPEAVAELVRSVDHTEEMIAAAWLHDVVEDCGVTIDAIRHNFGFEVFNMVYWLTDASVPSDGNRKVRKQIDLEHISRGSAEAKTIKLADVIDNTGSIVQYDSDFAKVYLAEKWALLGVLKEGDPVLWEKASEIVRIMD